MTDGRYRTLTLAPGERAVRVTRKWLNREPVLAYVSVVADPDDDRIAWLVLETPGPYRADPAGRQRIVKQ